VHLIWLFDNQQLFSAFVTLRFITECSFFRNESDIRSGP